MLDDVERREGLPGWECPGAQRDPRKFVGALHRLTQPERLLISEWA